MYTKKVWSFPPCSPSGPEITNTSNKEKKAVHTCKSGTALLILRTYIRNFSGFLVYDKHALLRMPPQRGLNG